MNKSKITLLLVASDPVSTNRILSLLSADSYAHWQVEQVSGGIALPETDPFGSASPDECSASLQLPMQWQAYDAIVLDCSFVVAHLAGRLELVQALSSTLPVILIAKACDESMAERAFRFGIQDCLAYSELTSALLGRSILYAIERKRNEQALRASEERYRVISELVTDFVSSHAVNANGVSAFEWSTGAVERITGYTTAEIDERGGLFGLLHSADREIALARRQRLLSGQNDKSEFRIIAKDGSLHWLRTYTVPIWDKAEQRVVRLYGAVQDISKEKAVEEQLRRANEELEQKVAERTARLARANEALLEAEERYRLLVEQIPAAVYVDEITGLDDTAIIYISPYIEMILGYSASEFYQNELLWSQLIHPADRQRALLFYRQQEPMNVPLATEYRMITRTGQEVWIRDEFMILPGNAEHKRAFQGVVYDVTKRKQFEATLQQQSAELEARNSAMNKLNGELAEAMQHKDQFLASVSHELRTPLSVVLTLTESLRLGIYGNLSERQANAIQRVDKNSRLLLALINDILDLAQVESGEFDLAITPVDVQAVCQESLQLMQETARQKQVNMSSSFDSAVACIKADGRRLGQILINLLGNAIKFTPKGGEVGVSIEGDADQQFARFVVWDTGIGISPEDQERLFQPFVQLEAGRNLHAAGTGLGLALVHRLVKLHGGAVSVQSDVGRGSRFIVSLPWSR